MCGNPVFLRDPAGRVRARRKDPVDVPDVAPFKERLDRQSHVRQPALESGLVGEDSLDRGDSPDAAGLEEKAIQVESDDDVQIGKQPADQSSRAHVEAEPAKKRYRPPVGR